MTGIAFVRSQTPFGGFHVSRLGGFITPVNAGKGRFASYLAPPPPIDISPKNTLISRGHISALYSSPISFSEDGRETFEDYRNTGDNGLLRIIVLIPGPAMAGLTSTAI